MMNQANFQNMSGSAIGSHGGPPHIGPPTNGGPHIHQQVMRILSQQQTPQGWQTAVQTQQRAYIIIQIVSQLRLLPSAFDLGQQVQLAINFELKAFRESPDKHAYENSCKRKLEDIHQQRSKISAGLQQHLNQPNQSMSAPQLPQNLGQSLGQPQGRGQFPPGAQNPQPQQMMQMPGLSMQPQQTSQQQPLPIGHPQGPMPQAQPVLRQSAGQPQFTPEENAQISRMASNMLQNTQSQQIEAIQNNLRNMTPEQHAQISRMGQDPLTFFFRNQAAKKFREQKMLAARANQGITGPQAVAMMNGQPRPMSQNATHSQTQQVPGGQQSLDHIYGQQQAALRSQEAGQDVVPANTAQANADQRGPARMNLQSNLSATANRTIQNGTTNNTQPQQFWNAQSSQQNLTQAANMAANAQTSNFGSSTPAPGSVLQGQIGGLDNLVTRTPSQTHTLPNLNKASAPPGQATNMWQQRPPQGNPPNVQNPPMTQQTPQQRGGPDAIQQRSMMPSSFPPNIREHLANMSDDQRRNFMMDFQRKQHQAARVQQAQQVQNQQRVAQAANARAAMGDSMSMATQASQPSIQLPGQQSMLQNSQAGFPQKPFVGGLMNQQPMPFQRGPQQAGQMQREGSLISGPLTEEYARQMDQQMFPPGILNINSPLSKTPKDVRTWGQLKAWVAENAQHLPLGSLDKLKNLQALHYQNLSTQQGPRPTQPTGVSANNIGNVQQQAPFAQMVSLPNNQASLTAARPLNPMNVPPPTLQEVQATRNRLPPQHKGATDDQIRGLIIKQRQNEMMNKLRAQQAHNQQVLNGVQRPSVTQNQANLTNGSIDPQPNAQMQPSRPPTEPSIKPTAPVKDQGNRQGQASRNTQGSKQPQKNLKRNSNDDVIEVPNPNARTAASGFQGHSQNQPPKDGLSPHLTQEQKARLDLQRPTVQREAAQPQLQNADDQASTRAIINSHSQEEKVRRNMRLKQLMIEVTQSIPPRKAVQMSPQTRQQMAQRLSELSHMVTRMDQTLPLFFQARPDENFTKELIYTRQLVKAQYRDPQFNLIDQLTMSPEELEAAHTRLQRYFVFVMTKLAPPKSNANAGAQKQQQGQPSTQVSPPSQEKVQQLNAANLNAQQNALQAQRAAAHHMQKNLSHQSNRAPPAPTTDKPPQFPFTPQSPHGVPQAYGEQTLTQAQLMLPQNKRRKSNNHVASAASTPAPAHGTPVTKSSPLATKVTSPEAKRTQLPRVTFKCSSSTCQTGQNGFSTQAELDQHNSDVHEPKEPIIEDPADFALASVREALGLDENGKAVAPKETLEAPRMKVSTSAQSYTVVKQEISTPMARAATQNGPSPTSNLLKTPQASSGIKTPASDSKLITKDGKGKDTKVPSFDTKDATPPPFDPWVNSSISPETILSSWSSLADMQSVPSFTKIQMGLTPSSTDSSNGNKSKDNSPRPSDISESDAVKINLEGLPLNEETVNDDTSWLPHEWLDNSMYDNFEELGFGQDSSIGAMDWDMFGDADTIMVDVEPEMKGRQGGTEDQLEPGEWLKVYAPQKVEEKKKAEVAKKAKR